MTAVDFRPAHPSEAPLITQFQLDMALETENLKLDFATVRRGVLAVFEQQKGRYFACLVDGKFVGSMMILTEWSDWRNGEVWWIHSLYVLPEFRGQKLFSKFFAYIESQARSQSGVRGLRLYVDKTNKVAQAAYRKLGMKDDHYTTFELMWNSATPQPGG